jgi:hypothetical protein
VTRVEIERLASRGSKFGYGFSVRSEDWQRRDDRWCTWHHQRGYVGGKLKMDGSMRWATSDPATIHLPFLMY